MNETMNTVRIAKRLGLGAAHASWLAQLDRQHPSGPTPVLHSDAFATTVCKLKLTVEDAADVLRTMPSAEQDPELWWLLERSRCLLGHAIANQDGGAEPPPPLPPRLRLFPVHLILATVDIIRKYHQDIGIPEDTSWETLSHVGRAMAAYRVSHGEAGIQITRWDWLRFIGTLYQAGRLEVTPYHIRTRPEGAGPLFWYDEEMIAQLGPGFRKGDPALGLHVPASYPLTPQACVESLKRIGSAFASAYPGEPLRIATCTSWLLDDQLAEYLPEDANILSFQRRFTLVPGVREDDEAILRFVFGADRPKNLDELPQENTLERAVVSHLRTGRHWHMRTGWLELAS